MLHQLTLQLIYSILELELIHITLLGIFKLLKELHVFKNQSNRCKYSINSTLRHFETVAPGCKVLKKMIHLDCKRSFADCLTLIVNL